MSIRRETVSGVLRLQIARPEKKNAITAVMYQALADALDGASADASVRAILIHGLDEVFTSGNDLEDFQKNPPAGPEAPVLQFIRALGGCELPVVAAVNGPAVGIGTTMLYHCDLVYCGSDAVFSMPFVTLGLCPEFASSLLVPLYAGWHKAAEKLLLGDTISVAEACEMRIVSKVLAPAEVLPHATLQAERFAAMPPIALRESKRLMKKAFAAMTAQAIDDEVAVFTRLVRGAEAREAFTAFFERRRPDFSRVAGG